MPRQPSSSVYEFGRFRLDAQERVLLRDGAPVPLTLKALETLLVLVESQGHVVGKEELMRRVWPDSFVEENNLAQNISLLRRVLGENGDGTTLIETVPRRGYRFVTDVREVTREQAVWLVREQTRATIAIEEEETITDEVTIPSQAAETVAKPGATAAGELPARIERYKAAAITLAAMLLITLLGLGWFKLIRAGSAKHFERLSVVNLPNTGRSIRAAISPDGKFVVHSANINQEQSLWLRQVATASDVQLVALAKSHFEHLAFSPDGNHIYYSLTDWSKKEGGETGIYKMPALGGAALKLIDDTDGHFTLSPDGQRLAFVRNSKTQSALMVAQADGSQEQLLAIRQQPNFFRHLAWSPDGKAIASLARSVGADGVGFQVVEVKVSDGAQKPLSTQKWLVSSGLAWVPDGSAVVIAERGLWQVSYPGGETRRITSDATIHTQVSFTADASTLVSIPSKTTEDVWVITGRDFSNAQPITAGTSNYSVPRWTPDGKIVFRSSGSGNPDIWIMQADGTGQRQLTVNEAVDDYPVVSPDGRYIVFESNRQGAGNSCRIWRMEMDGNHPKQLTNGQADRRPQISPDGKWVVYTATDGKEPTLWKVPIEGGPALQLVRGYSANPAISPDGKLLAYSYRSKPPNSSLKVAIIPFEGGEPLKLPDIPGSADFDLRWTPDGHYLSYLSSAGGIFNVWVRPLDGGPPKQVTNFKDYHVQSFDWSRDGKSLVCSRQVTTLQVVLIKDVR